MCYRTSRFESRIRLDEDIWSSWVVPSWPISYVGSPSSPPPPNFFLFFLSHLPSSFPTFHHLNPPSNSHRYMVILIIIETIKIGKKKGEGEVSPIVEFFFKKKTKIISVYMNRWPIRKICGLPNRIGKNLVLLKLLRNWDHDNPLSPLFPFDLLLCLSLPLSHTHTYAPKIE